MWLGIVKRILHILNSIFSKDTRWINPFSCNAVRTWLIIFNPRDRNKMKSRHWKEEHVKERTPHLRIIQWVSMNSSSLEFIAVAFRRNTCVNSRTLRECNGKQKLHLRHDLNALMARSFCDFNYDAVSRAVAPLFVSRDTNHHAQRVTFGNCLVANRGFFWNVWPQKRISISICWIVTRLIYPRLYARFAYRCGRVSFMQTWLFVTCFHDKPDC